MANSIATYALGAFVQLSAMAKAGTGDIVLILYKSVGAATDTTMRNCQTVAALASAGLVECDFTGYCVDPDTECLTRRLGWTRYDQLVPGDEVLAYDQDAHVTRWERLDDVYINEHYRGPMWRLESRGFSAVTTPDHRWPVLRQFGSGPSRTRVPHTLTTETLPMSQSWLLMRSAPFTSDAEKLYSDEFVRIAAWYYTEGTLVRGGKSVAFCQSATHNPEYVEEIRRDLKALGAVTPNRPSACSQDGCGKAVYSLGMCRNHYCSDYRTMRRAGVGSEYTGRRRAEGLYVTEHARERDGLITWTLFGTEVDHLIAAVPGKRKVPTTEFLNALTPDQAKMFVEVSLAADGTKSERSFQQHDAARMDAFVHAAVLAGYGATLDRTGTSCSLNEKRPTMRLHRVRREQFDYSGTIWCPTVPSGFWVARRAGKVHITGNSRHVYAGSDITITTNTTTFTQTVAYAAHTWNPAGGATNNNIVKACVMYRPTSGSADSACTPLGIYDASGSAGGGTYTLDPGDLIDDA